MSLPFFIAGWSFVDEVKELAEPAPGPLTPGCWYHFQRDAEDAEARLLAAGIPLSAIQGVLAEDTRPRFELLDNDNFLLNLRGVNLNEGEKPDDMLSIRILFYNGVLISTRRFPSRAIADIRHDLSEGKGPSGLADVLVAIIDKLHQRIEDFVEPAETIIAEQEDEHSAEKSELMPLNKRLIKLRRFLKPQCFALDEMLDALPMLLADKRLALANARDTAVRINESVSFYLEHIAIIGQYQAHWHSERVNRNTYLLSIMSGIFLPISFLTGLLGVNIAGMPGIESPIAFTLFCISLVTLVVIEVALFKRWRFI
ncbi:CorA family divalent cation transporter [Halomonas huangheensis]|uniref:Magnesium transporter n=1 Tax=Halomonas huangheensis TaxID=1178482 RepID=W1NC56_9GAMM|nr:CorA family divalent cation transporter [Halomonas huangheensis]ALM53006.1 hypothetical protein AR456_12455 [Halomonas huangheensis]ERL53063.1 hypothetical protein BJB45_17455 [Halomonas huangheensis]